MVKVQKKRITRKQACNEKKCPACGSKNIEYEYTDCLCHRTYEGSGRTCWTYPTCEDCGFTAGGGGGNSAGGIWIWFSDLGKATHYEIKLP